jgi:hypothetical protein
LISLVNGLLILNFAYRFVKTVPTGESVADHEPHIARTVRLSKQGSAFCFPEHIDAQVGEALFRSARHLDKILSMQ